MEKPIDNPYEDEGFKCNCVEKNYYDISNKLNIITVLIIAVGLLAIIIIEMLKFKS